jgi:NAD(P)-dependent dehydrogenase (short-subunit alcohol dehydrogenase family)
MTQGTVSLTGKRVVIVGGSSGLGFAVAELAAELGAKLVIASSTCAKVDAALARLADAAGALVDIRREASIADFLDHLEPFDHLVVTAGDADPRRFASTDQIDLDIAHQAFEARVFGSIAFIKHGRHKVIPGGSITLTSGVLARRTRKGSPLPTATMGSVEALVRGFAADLAPLRINAVCPGLTLTQSILSRGVERVATLTAHLPLPRAASPAEVALAYIYLMLNTYVTGQILPVDGGESLV